MAADLHDMEGASIERVAQILKLMKPPLDVPKESERGAADVRVEIRRPRRARPTSAISCSCRPSTIRSATIRRSSRWPTPASRPSRCSTSGPARADKRSGERLGQATRHGYIVIAVDWQQPHQFTYDYSAREHHAVLGALRDACRRFSIDTDRVFLTGHGIGGDAAWDIALAHPDLWAGVIPIVAVADKFVSRYAKNAEYVPWYFVGGELDGDKMARNAVAARPLS